MNTTQEQTFKVNQPIQLCRFCDRALGKHDDDYCIACHDQLDNNGDEFAYDDDGFRDDE